MEGIRMFLFWTDEQFLGALPIMAAGTSTGRPKGFCKLLGKVTGEEREGAWLPRCKLARRLGAPRVARRPCPFRTGGYVPGGR
jgi:hypothetical protein